jgi:hypothetical protein
MDLLQQAIWFLAALLKVPENIPTLFSVGGLPALSSVYKRFPRPGKGNDKDKDEGSEDDQDKEASSSSSASAKERRQKNAPARHAAVEEPEVGSGSTYLVKPKRIMNALSVMQRMEEEYAGVKGAQQRVG